MSGTFLTREEDESVEAQQENLASKLDLTANAKQLLGENVAFVPVKVFVAQNPAPTKVFHQCGRAHLCSLLSKWQHTSAAQATCLWRS